MQKLIGVVRGQRGQRALPPVPPDLAGLRGCVLHEPAQPDKTDVVGVWMLWFDDDAVIDATGLDEAFLVDERPQWDYERSWRAGEVSPGIKRLSFVRTHVGTTRAQFAHHWREVHAPLARVHHPALWRYVQNVVVRSLTPEAPDTDGVAELSFRTDDDLRERMYDSEEGRQAIAQDVSSFIDIPRGWRVDTRERVLVPPPNSNTF